jgi:excisionase family DNA binding protein
MSASYLRVCQVAEELDVSTRTILRWIDAGRLDAVRLPGGRLRIAQSAWSAFLAHHATTNGAPTLASVDEGGE